MIVSLFVFAKATLTSFFFSLIHKIDKAREIKARIKHKAVPIQAIALTILESDLFASIFPKKSTVLITVNGRV